MGGEGIICVETITYVVMSFFRRRELYEVERFGIELPQWVIWRLDRYLFDCVDSP